jgi:membrane protein implicated in regulation of membrane protease activity
MIRTIIMTLLSAWASEFATLVWLLLAFVSAIIEVSIPHFGMAFVGAGAIAAAAAAFLGFGVAVQVGTFVVVMITSLVALRSSLVGYLGGKGVPSRTAALLGREGIVTHEIDPTLGSGRINVGGEDWAARGTEIIPAGVKVRVIGADGIVLEVTRT